MSSSRAYRVVVDTNIFVSALLWGGNPQKVILAWLDDAIYLLLSPFLASEIIVTLAHFGLPPSDLKRIEEILESHTIKIIPKKLVTVCRDPKDNNILDLCVAGRADYLITGDKDLLVLRVIKNTKIVTPSGFLKLLFSRFH